MVLNISESAYLVLSYDMGHHLSAPSLQPLVGHRFKAHLITIERCRLEREKATLLKMTFFNVCERAEEDI